MLTALSIAVSVLGMTSVSLAVAVHLLRRKMRRMEWADASRSLMDELQKSSTGTPNRPDRGERIANLRGTIEATKAIELTLADCKELPALLTLASARSNAAHAKHELRHLGVEA